MIFSEGVQMVRYLLICIGLSGGLLFTAQSADAQPTHRSTDSRRGDHSRPGGPREQAPFFEAMREVHLESSSKELFELLRHASIRKEIHLSDADAERLRANGREAFDAILAIQKKNRDISATKEELKLQLREVLGPLEEKSFEILRQSGADFKRLMGIYVQARGYRALLNDKVAQQIGLQGEALDAFRQFRQEQWRAIMEDTRRAVEKEIRNAPPGSKPRAAISKLFRRAEEQLDEKLASQLTGEQLAAFESLKGPKFEEMPEQLFSSPSDHRRGGRPERHREPPQ